MKTRELIVVITLCGSLLLPMLAFGQGATGTILGTVKDSSGAILPGVNVTVTHLGTNTSRSTVTSDSGDYVIPQLLVGSYDIKAELAGFKTSVQSGASLQVDQRARVDFTLQVGEVRDQITVSGEAPLVQTESGSVGQVIQSQAIVRLPLNGRNFMQLTLLAPGFTNPPGDTLRQSYQGIAPTVNGARSENNNYTLDGTSNTEHWTGNVATVPPLDSLDQFKLQTANYSAEYGQGGGAIVNVVTKSGTNKFHGSLWEFHRNDNLDARNFFAPTKPEFKRNQYGATVGGPIIRDKTFFFFAYEGLRQGKGITLVRLIPTPAELAGDFSQSINPKPVDPLTRLPFPNNVIPSSRIDGVSRQIAENFYPAPNSSDPARNHVVTPTGVTDNDNFGIRVDHNLRSNDTIFARYNRNDRDILDPGGWVACCDLLQRQTDHQGAIQYSHIFSPKAINEFKFGTNRVHKFGSDSSQDTDIPALLGLQNIPEVRETKQFVGLGTTGYASPSSRRFSEVVLNTFVWTDNFSYIRGKHAFKMGVEFSRFQFNDFFPPSMPLTMTFSGQLSGNGAADFILGRATSISITYLQPWFENRMTTGEAYFQDDWQVSSRLTINWGARYTTQWPTTERQDEQTGFNLQTGASKIPNTANIPGNWQGKYELIDRNTLFDQDNKIAPRFGFALRPFGNNRSVIRGGYGIFTVLEIGNATRQPATNPPFRLIYGNSDNVSGFGWNDGRPTLDQVAAGFATGFGPQFVCECWANGYMQNWNLTFEQEIGSQMVLSTAYVASKGTHLSRLYPLNQPDPGPGLIQPRRPYPEFSGITYIQNAANSNYHSLQARVEKRYSNGLTFLGAYTWSKALGDASTLNENAIRNPKCAECEKGRLNFDTRQRFVASYNYELPFGPGKAFLQNGAAGAIFGGWIISGITTFQTGFPLTVTTGRDAQNNGIGNLPDRVLSVDPNPEDRTINSWIPRAAFVENQPFKYGNAGRGIIDSPGINLWDFSIIREFRVRESMRIAFHADFFNMLNHAIFGFPNTSLVSAAFGTISSAGEPRDIQLGLKFNF